MNSVQNDLLRPYRVLDLTDDYGLLCGKVLGDMGADVIKIEPPGGNKARRRAPFIGLAQDPEQSLHWLAFNTSKRGITLNLECDEGKEIFRKLCQKADFVIESFPPGWLDHLGLGYKALEKLNPRIILTSITPFGQSGPYRDLRSSDITIMSMGGLVSMCGDADRAPVCHNLEQVTAQAGAQAAVATLIAHHFREMHGRGQQIDISMQECIVILTGHIHHWWFYEGKIQQRWGVKTERGHLRPQAIFACVDGYISWRVFTGSQGEKTRSLINWMDEEGMAGFLGDVDWIQIDMNDVSQEQLESWESIVAEFFLRHTKKELCEGAVKRGVMLFPVNTTADLVADAQMKSRRFWEMVDHPEMGGRFVYPGSPSKTDGAMWRPRHRAPQMGEHNSDIYCGELGMLQDEVTDLRRRNVI